jgi:hypothetical protein
MPRNVDKKYGTLKRSPPSLGPLLCTVYSNYDPTRQGLLQVYASDSLDTDTNAPPTYKVRRLSPYFGQTIGGGADDDWGSYTSNPSSYGQWQSPPDIGTQVVCIFIEGDDVGYCLGAHQDPNALTMIPAIGSSAQVTLNEGEGQSYGGSTVLPVTNINTKNPDLADTVDFLSAAKPVHSYVASIMQQQGILRDSYRGPITSSANREATSRVGWGVSTPGRPIYEGGYTDETLVSELGVDPNDVNQANYNIIARRGGHSLVMDDGDIIGRNQLIRLRTALGHQILMSDDGQMLSILHSNGQTYIELGKEGTIDLYATNSVNVRTQGDLNLHADNDLNLHAGRNVNIKATQNMFVDADNNYSQRVGNDHTSYALNNMSFKSDNAIGLLSANQLGIESGMEILETAPKIHMNGPSASLIPGIVEPIEVKQHPDTLFDKAVGWATALAQIDSITTRAPAHMPWQYANQGVDVTVESGADEALPATPDADISAINKAASEAGDAGGAAPGVTPATSASVPEVGAISGAIDKNATTSVLGGIATAAAMSDNLGGAVSKGTDIVTSAAGVATAAVGSFAQTPSQLSSGGVLKPGADTMVNTLVSAGKSVKQAMPKSAFSGKNGASNLDTLVGSTSTQAKSVVTNLQKGQTALTKIGAVTGKEASTAIGGIVAGTGSQMVGSLTGAGGLADTVSSTAAALTGGGSGLGTAVGGGADLLGSVTQGAKSTLASTLTGGTGGITKALDALNKAPDGFNITAGFDADIGASASSFKSITATFKKMPANVPVDLEALAKEAAASVTAAAEGVTGTDLASFSVDTSIADNAISDATSAVSALTGSPTSLANAGGLASAASIVSTGASATTAAVVASGMSALPGGQKIGGSLVDNAKGSVNAIADGLGALSSEVGSIASDAFSGGDPGAGIKDLLGDASSKLDGLTDTLSGSLSPGASAALVSALSSLTSGGGSTITLPTVALNTFGTRESLMGLVNEVLGNPKVPRPNLLGKIPAAALGAFASLKALTKKLKTAQKAVASQEKQIAAKQASYAELVTSLPAGSPEIAEAKAQYEAALNSPAYTAAKAEVKAVAEEIKQSTAPTVVDSSLNQFQDLENLITQTSNNQTAQVLNNQSTSNATQASITAQQTVNILDDGLNTYSVIEAGEGQPVIPGAEEVVENTVEAVTGQVTDPTPPTDGAGSMGGFLQGDFGLGGNSGGGGGEGDGGIGGTNWKWDQTLSQWKLK